MRREDEFLLSVCIFVPFYVQFNYITAFGGPWKWDHGYIETLKDTL